MEKNIPHTPKTDQKIPTAFFTAGFQGPGGNAIWTNGSSGHALLLANCAGSITNSRDGAGYHLTSRVSCTGAGLATACAQDINVDVQRYAQIIHIHYADTNVAKDK